MAHVLIGFAEALPAAEVVFSLRAAGHRVSAFARRSDLPLARLPLEGLHVLPAPEEDSAASVTALRDLIARTKADRVLPLDDAGLWLVDATGTQRTAGAQGEQARIALDKTVQIEIAQAVGLDVPPTVVIRTPQDFAQIAAFPAILRPALALRVRNGRLGKSDALYLPDAAEAAVVQRHSFAQVTEPYLAQPLIAGVGEGVFGFAGPDGVTAWSGHRRVRMMNPHGSGSSACAVAVPDVDLKARVADFIARTGWQGPFMVELLRDSAGTAWFMELNGRMWGSMALARRQGLEYPAWAVEQSLNKVFSPQVMAQPLPVPVMRHLGRELLHLAFVLRGPSSAFHRANWPRFSRSAAAVLKPGAGQGFYNHDPAHRFYFMHEALWMLRNRLKRGGR